MKIERIGHRNAKNRAIRRGLVSVLFHLGFSLCEVRSYFRRALLFPLKATWFFWHSLFISYTSQFGILALSSPVEWQFSFTSFCPCPNVLRRDFWLYILWMIGKANFIFLFPVSDKFSSCPFNNTFIAIFQFVCNNTVCVDTFSIRDSCVSEPRILLLNRHHQGVPA